MEAMSTALTVVGDEEVGSGFSCEGDGDEELGKLTVLVSSLILKMLAMEKDLLFGLG